MTSPRDSFSDKPLPDAEPKLPSNAETRMAYANEIKLFDDPKLVESFFNDIFHNKLHSHFRGTIAYQPGDTNILPGQIVPVDDDVVAGEERKVLSENKEDDLKDRRDFLSSLSSEDYAVFFKLLKEAIPNFSNIDLESLGQTYPTDNAAKILEAFEILEKNGFGRVGGNVVFWSGAAAKKFASSAEFAAKYPNTHAAGDTFLSMVFNMQTIAEEAQKEAASKHNTSLSDDEKHQQKIAFNQLGTVLAKIASAYLASKVVRGSDVHVLMSSGKPSEKAGLLVGNIFFDDELVRLRARGCNVILHVYNNEDPNNPKWEEVSFEDVLIRRRNFYHSELFQQLASNYQLTLSEPEKYENPTENQAAPLYLYIENNSLCYKVMKPTGEIAMGIVPKKLLENIDLTQLNDATLEQLKPIVLAVTARRNHTYDINDKPEDRVKYAPDNETSVLNPNAWKEHGESAGRKETKGGTYLKLRKNIERARQRIQDRPKQEVTIHLPPPKENVDAENSAAAHQTGDVVTKTSASISSNHSVFFHDGRNSTNITAENKNDSDKNKDSDKDNDTTVRIHLGNPT